MNAVMAQDDVIWTQSYGGESSDGARGVCATSDGGLLMTGYTYSMGNGDTDLYLIKTDASGNEIWSEAYGGVGREYGYAVMEASNGHYFAVGYTTSAGAGLRDVYLIEVDINGNLLSERTFGGEDEDVGRAICENADGTTAICGYTASYGAGEIDVYLILIDPQGTQTELTYGGAVGDFGMSIQPLADGYIIGGATGSYNTGNRDYYLVRIDESGGELWHQIYGAPANYDIGFSVCCTDDGGFAITGHSDIHLSDLMGCDVHRTDANGTLLWSKRIREGTYYDYGKSIISTDDGGFVICGATKNRTAGTNDLYLTRLDEDGDIIWKKVLGGDQTEWGSGLCAVDGGFVVVGHQDLEGDGYFDVLAMKITNIVPRIGADQNSGHAPLEVSFLDQSLGTPTSWRWDLDGDGDIDSEEQNPAWNYTEPGMYTVSLEVGDEWYSETITREAYVRVFDGNSSLEFNGENGEALCDASPSLGITDGLTIESWICPRGFGEVENLGYGRIVDKTSFAAALHGSGTVYNDESLMIIIRNQSGPPHIACTPESSIVLEEWQHVAATYDGITDDFHVYINGVEQIVTWNSPVSGQIRDNTDVDLYIGNNSTGGYTFDGMIDEVRIFNQARTAEEIRASMGDSLVDFSESLVGYWRMDEGCGPEIFDLSGCGNSGTLTDVGWWTGIPFELGAPELIDGTALVSSIRLLPVYPNPSSSIAYTGFDIKTTCQITLSVFDLQGRCVRVLANGEFEPGSYEVSWNGTSDSEKRVPSGVYMIRLGSGSVLRTKRCVVVR